MRKALILIILTALLLAALCACGGKTAPASPPQTIPAASPEISAPDEAAAAEAAEQPPAPQTPDDVTPILPEPEPAPEVPAPDRVLCAEAYTAEVYCCAEDVDGLQIESRRYVVSDGVTVTSFRAGGDGTPCFFSRTLSGPGTICRAGRLGQSGA